MKRIFDAAFSADGQRIASASEDCTVMLWDRDGQQLATLRDKGMDPAIAVVFLPAGLVTGHMDRMARLWDANGALVARLEGHRADVRTLLASPPGEEFATAVNGGGEHDSQIRLWALDGAPRGVRTGHGDWVSALDFSRDGGLLASGSWDKTIRVWRQDGTCVSVLQGHAAPVEQVAFDASGTRLLSRARDWDARVWRWHGEPATLLIHAVGIVTAATYWGEDALVVSAAFHGITMVVGRTDRAIWAELPGAPPHGGTKCETRASPVSDTGHSESGRCIALVPTLWLEQRC